MRKYGAVWVAVLTLLLTTLACGIGGTEVVSEPEESSEPAAEGEQTTEPEESSDAPESDQPTADEAAAPVGTIENGEYCSGLTLEEIQSTLGFTGGAENHRSSTAFPYLCRFDGFDGTEPTSVYVALEVYGGDEQSASDRYASGLESGPSNIGFEERSGPWEAGFVHLGSLGTAPSVRFLDGPHFVIVSARGSDPEQLESVVELAMLVHERLPAEVSIGGDEGNAAAEEATPDGNPPPPTLAGTPDTALEFFNQAQLGQICGIYIAPTSSDNWGGNWITDGTLVGNGESYVIDEFVSGTYDLKVQDCTGNVYAWSVGLTLPPSDTPLAIDINDPEAAVNFYNDLDEDVCGLYMVRTAQFGELGWTRNLLNDGEAFEAGNFRFFELTNEAWNFRFDLCSGDSIESQNNLINQAVELNLSGLE
jgi:hypothetical protein